MDGRSCVPRNSEPASRRSHRRHDWPGIAHSVPRRLKSRFPPASHVDRVPACPAQCHRAAMSERTGPSVNRTRILGCVILGTVLAVGVVQAATPPLPLRDGVPTLAPLLEKVTPAVVNISVATRAPQAAQPAAARSLLPPFFFNLPEDAPAAPAAERGFRRDRRRRAGLRADQSPRRSSGRSRHGHAQGQPPLRGRGHRQRPGHGHRAAANRG